MDENSDRVTGALGVWITFEDVIAQILFFVSSADQTNIDEVREHVVCAGAVFACVLEGFSGDMFDAESVPELEVQNNPHLETGEGFRRRLLERIARALEMEDDRLTPAFLRQRLRLGQKAVELILPIQ